MKTAQGRDGGAFETAFGVGDIEVLFLFPVATWRIWHSRFPMLVSLLIAFRGNDLNMDVFKVNFKTANGDGSISGCPD